MAKADVKLQAAFALTLVADTPQVAHLEVATLSDASIYQVLDVVAVETYINGAAVTGWGGAGLMVAQLQTSGGVAFVAPSDDKFLYQIGNQSYNPLHNREQVTAPLMIAGDSFAVVVTASGHLAAAMNVVVNVYGNYRKLSEVEYLRLTC